VASTLFGTDAQIGVTRGVAEFHAGRPVFITGEHETVLALPVDGLNPERLSEFAALCAPAMPHLTVTARRARALGIDTADAISLRLSRRCDAETVLAYVAAAKFDCRVQTKRAGAAAEAAIQLAKISQGLPAVLVTDVVRDAIASGHHIVCMEADSIARFREESIGSVRLASSASVPLKSGKRATFVVFRNNMGESPAAIIIGKPDMRKPVPVRLHSACLTGDVFGSRRCDCGDQLQLSLDRLEARGGGIVLYLPQEGRGLGLANKMRTYQMQDDGLDTIDANTTLGFDEDERDYGMAARMLQLLECTTIVLMTNNPAKVTGLTRCAIDIAGRIPVEAPINIDNLRYLTAKAARAGHRLNEILLSGS
jgi:GTP cyclohydrolase II